MAATMDNHTKRVELDALDDTRATLKGPDGHHVTISRADWELYGRPGKLYVTFSTTVSGMALPEFE